MQKVVVLPAMIETTNSHNLTNFPSGGDTFIAVNEDHQPDSCRNPFTHHAIVTS